MKSTRRLISFILILSMLLCNSGMATLSDSVLTMPTALQIIGEEAFLGNTSIDKVVLSNNVTEIRARAFANSTLSEINLPDSLTFIDESAFDDITDLRVTAALGTYAYDWALNHHFITQVYPSEAVEYNGHHYYFLYDSRQWLGDGTPEAYDQYDQAKLTAISMGGYLAVINDANENAFLMNYMKSNGISWAYFGFEDTKRDRDVTGNFSFLLSGGGRNSSYRNWSVGEPNMAMEKFAQIERKWSSGKWVDNDSGNDSEKKYYIIEWDNEEDVEYPSWNGYVTSDTSVDTFIDSTSFTTKGKMNSSETVTVIAEMDDRYYVVAGHGTKLCWVDKQWISKSSSVAVTGISLNKTSATLNVGSTLALSATIKPENATNKKVIWSSNKTSVATVSDAGVVTAKAAGTATITATAADGSGKTATCVITVPEPSTGSEWNNPYATVTSQGNSNVDKGTVITDDMIGKVLRIDMVDGGWYRMVAPKDGEYSFSVLADAITVDSFRLKILINNVYIDDQYFYRSSDIQKKTLKNIQKGDVIAWWVCQADNGYAFKQPFMLKITVGNSSPVAVTGVYLNKTSATLNVGDALALSATIKPENATNKKVIWSSNKTSVATVSDTGVVTAKAAGTATISATAADGSGKQATCIINVPSSTVPVTNITLNQNSASLSVGKTLTLIATVTPDYATNKNVSWLSDNTSVATVNNSGVVTAKTVGSAKITATALDGSGTNATCFITVNTAFTSISLDKVNRTLIVGETIKLHAIAEPNDANDAVMWRSSDTSIANVDDEGTIIATGIGAVNITAFSESDDTVQAVCKLTISAQTSVLSIDTIEAIRKDQPSINDVVTWVVTTSGAVGQVKYSYVLYCNGRQIDKIEGTNYNSYQTVLNWAGEYKLSVECRDDSNRIALSDASTITIAQNSFLINSIENQTLKPNIGQELRWIVNAAGGIEPYSFNYTLYRKTSSNSKVAVNRINNSPDNQFSYVENRYDKTGLYYLEVSVTDANGRITTEKSEDIEVKSASLCLSIDEGTQKTNPKTFVSNRAISFTEDLITESSWTAYAIDSWISVSPTSGKGDTQFTVHVQRNYGATRVGRIAFTADNQTTYLTLEQDAYLSDTPELLQPQLSIDQRYPTIINNTNTITCSWDYDSRVKKYLIYLQSYDWETNDFWPIIKSPELSEGSFVFDNLSLQPGEIYNIEFIRYYGSKRTKQNYYFRIKPENNNDSITIDSGATDSIEFNSKSGAKNVKVNSSSMWTAYADVDWLLVGSSEIVDEIEEYNSSPEWYRTSHGRDGDKLYIYAYANSSNSPRTGNITVTCGSVRKTITVKQFQGYTCAQLTQPSLSQTRSAPTVLKPGALALKWSEHIGGTGKYLVRIEEYDNGWDRIVNQKNLMTRSFIVDSNLLKEGLNYRLELGTEIDSNEYVIETYYFRVAYSNELTVDVRISGTGTIGNDDGLRVDATASGGSGGYKYCFYLMKNKEIINRSIGWDPQSYWTFVLPDVGNYYVQVYAKDSDGTQVSFDSSAVTAVESSEYITIDNKTSVTKDIEASSTTLTVPVTASKNWTFSKDVSWLTIDASGYKNSNLKVTASANVGSSVRYGHVTVTCGSKQAVLTINQSGSGNVNVSSTTLDFGSSFSSQQVTVTSSASWSASPSDSWISISPSTGSSGTNLKIIVTGNNNGGMRNGSVTITAGGARTVISINQQGTSKAVITRVRNICTVQTGEEADIMVHTANATYVRMIIDGKYTSPNYIVNPDFDNLAKVKYTFSSSGSRSLTFSAYANGVWYDDTTVYTLEVTAPNGDLDAPVARTDKAIYRPKEKPVITWTDGGNAQKYKIYLTKDGQSIRTIEQIGKRLELTSSDTEMAGHYAVTIMSTAPGYEQAQGGVEFDVQWDGYLQCKTATAYYDRNLTNSKVQLRFGIEYTISEESIVGDSVVGAISSNGVFLGYSTTSILGTSFWHPCLKNGEYKHTWYTGYEAAHPHKVFRRCIECEVVEYTGNIAQNASAEISNCCLCGNHSYTFSYYQSTHPHYAVDKCVRCTTTTRIDKNSIKESFEGCAICMGTGSESDDDDTLGTVTFFGYTNNTVSNRDISVLNSGLTVQWKADNAVAYEYSVVETSNQPVSTTGGQKVFRSGMESMPVKPGQDTRGFIAGVTIRLNELTVGKYVQFIVRSVAEDGTKTPYQWVAFRINNDGHQGYLPYDGASFQALLEANWNDNYSTLGEAYEFWHQPLNYAVVKIRQSTDVNPTAFIAGCINTLWSINESAVKRILADSGINANSITDAITQVRAKTAETNLIMAGLTAEDYRTLVAIMSNNDTVLDAEKKVVGDAEKTLTWIEDINDQLTYNENTDYATVLSSVQDWYDSLNESALKEYFDDMIEKISSVVNKGLRAAEPTFAHINDWSITKKIQHLQNKYGGESWIETAKYVVMYINVFVKTTLYYNTILTFNEMEIHQLELAKKNVDSRLGAILDRVIREIDNRDSKVYIIADMIQMALQEGVELAINFTLEKTLTSITSGGYDIAKLIVGLFGLIKQDKLDAYLEYDELLDITRGVKDTVSQNLRNGKHPLTNSEIYSLQKDVYSYIDMMKKLAIAEKKFRDADGSTAAGYRYESFLEQINRKFGEVSIIG